LVHLRENCDKGRKAYVTPFSDDWHLCIAREAGYMYLNGRAGVAGSPDIMQMLLARSALERGMQLVAGMLNHRDTQDVRQSSQDRSQFQLVSWQPGAHSRREDELARRQQHPFG
jgi:hypothetical protein